MKKSIIYTFSGTGNTKKIANLYAEEFRKNDVSVTVFDIFEGCTVIDPNSYDYVGIAYPIHGFNAPKIVLDFAKKLPPAIAPKNYFVLKSSGEPLQINNISSLLLHSVLKKKGYVSSGEYHYVMPYNMIFRHTDEKAAKMYKTAKQLCQIEAREVLQNKPHHLRKIPFGNVIAGIFRIEHIAMKVNGRFFRVDQDKCIACGKCIKNCPSNNIRIENGKFVFGGDCLMCAKCSFNCPTDAFNIGVLNGWRVNGAYNFNCLVTNEQDKHARYCKKSYQKYFDAADKKIALQAGNINHYGVNL